MGAFIFYCHQPNIQFAARVMNVEVEVVSDDSIRVSWDSIGLPEITGYVVHYSPTRGDSVIEEHTVKLSNINSVLLGCLMTEIEYLVQVTGLAKVDGDLIIGDSANLFYSMVYLPESKMNFSIVRWE